MCRRVLVARAFDDAMEASEVSNRSLADTLNVNERMVRWWRSGERPLLIARILQLPQSLRAEFLRRLAEQGAAPLAAPSPEAAARAGQKRVHRLPGRINDALDPTSPGGASIAPCERVGIRQDYAAIGLALGPILSEEVPS